MTLHCVHGDNVEMQTLDLNFLSEDLFFKDPPPTLVDREVGNLKLGTGKVGTAF